MPAPAVFTADSAVPAAVEVVLAEVQSAAVVLAEVQCAAVVLAEVVVHMPGVAVEATTDKQAEPT